MINRETNAQRRPGTYVVECAIVYPVTFFLILSIIFGSAGVFRYQEMASLAREAARYGSTHGAQYRKDAGLSVGTAGSSEESDSTAPVDYTKSPYNTSPWSSGGTGMILWFKCHPADTSGAHPNEWADEIYDGSVRGRFVLLDPNSLQFWIGWSKVVNQTSTPDNYPGSRITASVRYQAFPEAFIWWRPSATMVTVSTSAMPITN
jgi:hypothetical protein